MGACLSVGYGMWDWLMCGGFIFIALATDFGADLTLVNVGFFFWKPAFT